MIKKRTRPQTRVRDPSLDPSDSEPTDPQQDQDEGGGLPYVLAYPLQLQPSRLICNPSATVSLNFSSFANSAVLSKE